MSWRERLRRWGWDNHEYQLGNHELYWFWHDGHGGAVGIRRVKPGHRGDLLREPFLDLTITTGDGWPWQVWREELRRWAFDMHEHKLLGLELFWFWHSRHSCAFGFHRPKTGRHVRLGNNGHGDEWRDPRVELTLLISRPGRADNRIRNP